MEGIGSYVMRAAAHARATAGAATGDALTRVWPGTALIVPVLAAEPVIAAWLLQRRVTFDGAPLHVTGMYPFLPARRVRAQAEEDVAGLARSIEPFDFALTHVRSFPGVTYLTPEPEAPFVDMTRAIELRWPSCVPYGGAFDTVVPHMTVALGGRLPADRGLLEQELPILARAEEIWLIEQTRHGWRTRRRFPLGNRAPATVPRDGAGAGTGSPA